MFIADLHIHSRYSRATSKSLTIQKLAAWAEIKGLSVIATGDFTHPGWMKEIEDNLSQMDNGLLRLKEKSPLNSQINFTLDYPLYSSVHFILCSEISSIYKKNGKIRKIHNLVFMPSVEKAKEFNKKLENIGNLSSDGRPILGIPSDELLDIVLNVDPKAFLVPAHIWTPWFSLFGSNSGFDSIEECFGSLSEEIFALETGLSSDPQMNWLWSALDRYYLISNSDAHSGEKLGREANLFKGEVSYFNIYESLKYKTGNFLGTIEFFPEEGKYHLDGHRKCGVVLEPIETMKLKNICPVCNQPLTIGVLHRIYSLADRQSPQKPPGAPGFWSLIPLNEIISEITKKGPSTKTVYNIYASLINEFQSELKILFEVPEQEIKKISPKLSEAISLMRQGKVQKIPGFDGQYGRIFIFDEQKSKSKKTTWEQSRIISKEDKEVATNNVNYNEEQQKAISSDDTPILVVAGPGTGKTRTLIGRTLYLIKQQKVPSSKILLISFTIAAANEIEQRLSNLLPKDDLPKIATLHSFGYELIKNIKGEVPLILDENQSKELFLKGSNDSTIWDRYSYEREKLLPISENELHKSYTKEKQRLKAYDYIDLIEFLVDFFKTNQSSYEHILIDEVQDLSSLQLTAIKAMSTSGKGLFLIGDPDQAIYSFRGGSSNIIGELTKLYPNLNIITLKKNYRSAKDIIEFSSPLIRFGSKTMGVNETKGSIFLYSAESSEMEANFIAKKIKELIGGTSHLETDVGQKGRFAPSDIAILVRFKAMIPSIKKALDKFGIPCSSPEQINFYEDPSIEKFLTIIAKRLNNEKTIIDNIDINQLSKIKKQLVEASIFDEIFFQSDNFKKMEKRFKEVKDWRELLSSISLEKEYDSIKKISQKVIITTLHGSKGLEFEAVFIPAVEENIIPFNREIFSNDSSKWNLQADIEEEKRLLYVGLTRAKTYLFLSHAKQRLIYGKRYHLNPSPFLKLLPIKLATRIKTTVKKIKKIETLKLV